MSFLGQTKNTKSSPTMNTNNRQKKSLQAQILELDAYTGIFYSQNPKRMSPITPKRVKAGVSVEAAVVIPLFLFFIINIIAIIGFFGNFGEALSEVQQQARTEALSSNNIDEHGDSLVTYSKQIVFSPVISSMGFSSSSQTVTMSYRKWNGYDLSKSWNMSDSEEYVYITEHGTSYHMNRDCIHLKVTLLISDASGIVNKRNTSGSQYTPCERCGGNGTGIVFYTPNGNRYHAKADCSGLKRTILTVKLSEVGGRKACKSCK